jgi:hypothetical protein
MDAEIRLLKVTCPISDQEIAHSVQQLRLPKGAERHLKRSITYWYMQAKNLELAWSEDVTAQRRDYVNRRLALGDSPGAIVFPTHFDRVDLWLPEIAVRLSDVRTELSHLPPVVVAELILRLGSDSYETALCVMDKMSEALRQVGSVWHRPKSGRPSWEMKSYAIDLLVCAIEDVTGEEFPSPRSPKRVAEIDLVRLLAAKLFPGATRENIETMLMHFQKRRLREAASEG